MVETKNNILLKQEILDVCTKKQQALIENFKERIKALLDTEGLGNEEPYDTVDQATALQIIPELNTLNEALESAHQKMDLLENLKRSAHEIHVQPSLGAVVVTDKYTFFISSSPEKLKLHDQTYVGISTVSPLFMAMRGKRAGEKFVFNGVTYTINEIF